jgi:hypothetical protein
LNPRAKKTSLEKYFGHYGKIREIDWNPGDQYAYLLYDNIVDAEDARNSLNEKPLPNGCSDELRIDYGDPKRFESSLNEHSRSVSRLRSVSRSNSVSRSRTRSRTQTKSRTRSRTRSKSRSESPIQPPPPVLSTHKRGSHAHGTDNGHYSSSSNDEKAYKKQKISSTMSRKIKTPPIEEEEDDRSPQNVKHHRRRHHRHNDEQDVDAETKPDNDLKMEQHEPEVPVKDSLVNKDSKLNQITNIPDISTVTKHTWSGVFTLKKIAFPTKFFLLAGNRTFAEELLPLNSDNSVVNLANLPSLRITQRLRLDPVKVDELEKKLYESNYLQQQQPNGQSSDSCQFSVLIALPYELDSTKKEKGDDGEIVDDAGVAAVATSLQQRSLHNLIIYLNQKSAAGVIPLPDDDRPTAIVHAFPPNCQFSIKLLKQLLPNLKSTDVLNSSSTSISNNSLNCAINSDYLIIVLLKN